MITILNTTELRAPNLATLFHIIRENRFNPFESVPLATLRFNSRRCGQMDKGVVLRRP